MKQKLRVAFVINDLLLGGAQNAVFNIASKLDLQRFEPIVYFLNTYPNRPNLVAEFQNKGISVQYIGDGGKTNISAAIRKLRKLWHAPKPDIVHLHLVDATIAGVLAARLSGVRKIIVHEHQTHTHYSWKIRLVYKLIRPLTTLSIFFSPVIENELFRSSATLVVPPITLTRKSYSIYNGIDCEKIEEIKKTNVREQKRIELDTPQNALVVVSVARLVSWKGQEVLLEAFARIADKIETAHLWILGEGPLKETLERRVGELQLSDRVHLFGARTDVYQVLAASDIGALTLLYAPGEAAESIGIAGFEMMAAGIPLIASDYPSAREFISSGETGALVSPGDIPSYEHALLQLLGNTEERARIGAAGATLIRERLDWRRIVPIYERIYELIFSS